MLPDNCFYSKAEGVQEKKLLQCSTDAAQLQQNRNVEIEIEKEIEIEIEIDKEKRERRAHSS